MADKRLLTKTLGTGSKYRYWVLVKHFFLMSLRFHEKATLDFWPIYSNFFANTVFGAWIGIRILDLDRIQTVKN